MLPEFWNSLNLSKRLYGRLLEPICSRYGLARMELDILLFLANNEGYDTAADIIARRRLTKSHVSVSIKRLEAAGYVERRFYPGNRKAAHLALLPPALPAVADGRAAQADFFQAIFQGFTPEETQAVTDAFIKMAGNIRAALSEEP